ncbi:abortive infection family protein [Lactiplantibacillus paraplantarum]|uniref:abortive infection family protein n=1 Tax=Lactiplantibacillus paraplantarum TaxID=60520 RepID=UPI0023AA52CB|nr:abortive infection family protein [Lactiplantibacillus paraplantarum]WEE35632.1 abortive infection family protein [Lactiplantibacillus paraplantarum]
MKDQDFRLLITKKIIEILIGDSLDIVPHLSKDDIISLFEMFGKNRGNGNVRLEGNRIETMKTVMVSAQTNNRTSSLLSYLFSDSSLMNKINQEIVKKYDGDSSDQNRKTARQQIVSRALQSINAILKYSGKKLIQNSIGQFEIIGISSEPQVFMNTDVTFDEVNELSKKAIDALKSGDLDSVITKSRTVLETTFTTILNRHHIKYKDDGNLSAYKGDTFKELGLKINQSTNPRFREMISGMNKIVDAIGRMRNKDSDAHASNEKVALSFEECELVLNTALSLSIYIKRLDDKYDDFVF